MEEGHVVHRFSCIFNHKFIAFLIKNSIYVTLVTWMAFDLKINWFLFIWKTSKYSRKFFYNRHHVQITSQSRPSFDFQMWKKSFEIQNNHLRIPFRMCIKNLIIHENHKKIKVNKNTRWNALTFMKIYSQEFSRRLVNAFFRTNKSKSKKKIIYWHGGYEIIIIFFLECLLYMLLETNDDAIFWKLSVCKSKNFLFLKRIRKRRQTEDKTSFSLMMRYCFTLFLRSKVPTYIHK